MDESDQKGKGKLESTDSISLPEDSKITAAEEESGSGTEIVEPTDLPSDPGNDLAATAIDDSSETGLPMELDAEGNPLGGGDTPSVGSSPGVTPVHYASGSYKSHRGPGRPRKDGQSPVPRKKM